MSAKGVLRLLLGLALVAAVVAAMMYREHFDSAALEQWVADAGAAGPLLFTLLYAVAAVLFLPGSVLTLAGGALFGPVWGTIYNLTGATLGAALAFVAARYLAGDWVSRRTGGRLKQLITGVEKEGWRFVAFVRLVPLFPFNLLNYALGLTRIGFVPYVVTSYLTMLPGAVAYTYLGYAGREAVAGGEGLIQKGLLALALLAVAAFLPGLIRRLRAPANAVDVPALRAGLADGSLAGVLDVRDEAEYSAGHIEGARHIPVGELSGRLQELEDWREGPFAVICRTDRRSAAAVRQLEAAGFAEPILVREGMQRWEQEAMPVQQAAAGSANA